MGLRRTPLRSDPKKARAWERRSRRNNQLDRSTPLKRWTRINPVNRKRRSREWKRAYGSEDRVQRIKRRTCYLDGCRSPAVNAHTESGGMGRKADWTTVADICEPHHTLRADSLHQLGSVERFDEVHGTDLKARAAWLAEEEKP